MNNHCSRLTELKKPIKWELIEVGQIIFNKRFKHLIYLLTYSFENCYKKLEKM